MKFDRPTAGEEINTSGEVVAARPAATLILLRDADAGPEVLLVQRNPEQKFMGGAWVFPGGAVHKGEDEEGSARRELAEEAGVELSDSHELVRFSRWITPAQITVRFDTHFFLAEAPAGTDPSVDGEECVAFTWVRPKSALDAGASGDMLLVFPTIKHLEQLVEFGSVSEALETARARRVQPVEPRVLVEGGVASVLLPGEPGYDDVPPPP